ncbi:hypothetical protein ACI782_07145 [Geodermatophilus sp. SYSU D00703]
MARHLLDETAEFTMPTLGRHAATEEDAPADLTQRLDGMARRQPPVGPRRHAEDRAE